MRIAVVGTGGCLGGLLTRAGVAAQVEIARGHSNDNLLWCGCEEQVT
jgi:hypothetical protein